MRAEIEPVVEETADRGEIHTHPAYGNITMSVVSGGDKTLFGSDLGHGQTIRICVNEASLRRDLHMDWVFGGSTLDESPFAYKNIFEVMDMQAELVDVLHHIKPLINIEGAGKEC